MPRSLVRDGLNLYYGKGHQAGKDGIPVDNCPYKTKAYKNSWIRGWYDQKQEAEQEQKPKVADLLNPESKVKYPEGLPLSKSLLGEVRYNLLCQKFDLTDDYKYALFPLSTEKHAENSITNFGFYKRYDSYYELNEENDKAEPVFLSTDFVHWAAYYMQPISIEDMAAKNVVKPYHKLYEAKYNTVTRVITNVFFEGIDYNKHLQNQALHYLKAIPERPDKYYIAGENYVVTNSRRKDIEPYIDVENTILPATLDAVKAYKSFFTLELAKSIAENQEAIASFQKKVIALASEVNIAKQKLRAIENAVCADLEESLAAFKLLDIEEIKFTHKSFIIKTNDMFFITNKNTKKFAGKYLIIIGYDMKIQIKNIKKYADQPIHIHGNSFNDNVCLGSYRGALVKSALEGDYVGLAANTIEFLRTANPSDGSYISNIRKYKTEPPTAEHITCSELVNIFDFDKKWEERNRRSERQRIEEESTEKTYPRPFDSVSGKVISLDDLPDEDGEKMDMEEYEEEMEDADADADDDDDDDEIKDDETEDDETEDDETEDDETEDDETEDELPRPRGRGRLIGSRIRS